jgi:hypothetical protein
MKWHLDVRTFDRRSRPSVLATHKAFIRKGTLGATTEAGEIVALQSDGKWDPATASAAALVALGVAVQGGGDGDSVDIVTYGPCEVRHRRDARHGKIYISDGTTPASTRDGRHEGDHRLCRDLRDLFVQPIPVAWHKEI